MTISFIEVSAIDDGQRLDRWFKKNVPGVPYSLLQKLIRKGAIKIDGKRAKADQKLAKGQKVRIPKVEVHIPEIQQKPIISEADAKKNLLDNVIYKDKNIIAINKPPGLPAQGGSGVRLNVDDMLDYLKFEKKEKPKLVHRIDKDTSGVMLIARSTETARILGRAFEGRSVKKTYWTVVVGKLKEKQGKINLPLSVSEDGREEKTVVDEKNGKRAITYYKVLEEAGGKLSFVAVMPETGRKHQIRVHLAALGNPILGDGKYGGKQAFIDGLSNKMHLHARRIVIEGSEVRDQGSEKVKTHKSPHSINKPASTSGLPPLDITAPLPKHMKATWEMFGVDINDETDVFGEL